MWWELVDISQNWTSSSADLSAPVQGPCLKKRSHHGSTQSSMSTSTSTGNTAGKDGSRTGGKVDASPSSVILTTDDIPRIEMLPPSTYETDRDTATLARQEPKVMQDIPPIDARRLMRRKSTLKSTRHIVAALGCAVLALAAAEVGRHVGQYARLLAQSVDIPYVLIAGFCAQLVVSRLQGAKPTPCALDAL